MIENRTFRTRPDSGQRQDQIIGDFMKRSFVIFGSVLLSACGFVSSGPPASICDTKLPASNRWDGAIVRWRGVVVSAEPHGMFFAGECGARRGIPIVSLPPGPAANALEASANVNRFRPGAMRAVVTAKIVRRGLKVTKIEQFQFTPMTDDQNRRFWRNVMGMPGMSGSLDVR